jgi:hypothetical protein
MNRIDRIERIKVFRADDFEDIVNLVKKKLKNDGFIIVDFSSDPEEDYLSMIAKSIGIIEKEDMVSKNSSLVYANFIQTLEPFTSNQIKFPISSTMIRRLPLHTDDYPSEYPSDLVALECVNPSFFGGDTLVAKLTDIIPKLSPDIIDSLMSNIFPCEDGVTSILWKEAKTYKIRFNQLEIRELCKSRSFELSSRANFAIENLALIAQLSSKKTRLLPRECIFIDNKSVLHGRTAFPQFSGRLLRRMKVKFQVSDIRLSNRQV